MTQKIKKHWIIERLLKDISCYVVARNINECVMEYEVRPVLLFDAKNSDVFNYYDDQGDNTDFDNSEILVKGTIKWDGCSDNYFGSGGGYIHACSRSEMVRIGKLFDYLFDLAKEIKSHE